MGLYSKFESRVLSILHEMTRLLTVWGSKETCSILTRAMQSCRSCNVEDYITVPTSRQLCSSAFKLTRKWCSISNCALLPSSYFLRLLQFENHRPAGVSCCNARKFDVSYGSPNSHQGRAMMNRAFRSGLLQQARPSSLCIIALGATLIVKIHHCTY
jgi:hypothetical protein